MIHVHTAAVPCKITALQQKLDTRTGRPTESNPEVLQAGDRAMVEMEPQSPLVVESFRDCLALGRFAIRDGGKTIGSGLVFTVNH